MAHLVLLSGLTLIASIAVSAVFYMLCFLVAEYRRDKEE